MNGNQYIETNTAFLRKLLAIFLLVIYLFNLAGYSLFFGILARQSTSSVEQAIGTNTFNDKDLVEIKVPLQVPYLDSRNSYEAVSGEITINGHHHSYVKRKIANDTLYLMCLPNRQKDQIQLAKTDYGKMANDFDSEKKDDHAAKKSANLLQGAIWQHFQYILIHPNASAATLKGFLIAPAVEGYQSLPYLPPDLNS